MVKQSKRRPERPADVRPSPEDTPIDDVASFGKVAGDQAASGLPQGVVWPLFIYVIARAIGALRRFLLGGKRLR